ncbi:adenine deaminase [Flavobacterium psychrophilum]|uniref:adenine deaminase n=1 Tax=Flavobacterium psychrophilum TaxID=96345 RepID=UPI0004F7DEC6|nr:adenine deaminase [Flavobacterium psychrophilum]AIN74780.1 adenine deaminase [Flavobacterium psychrophilum FPG3]EKT2069848.1 adenine deaminase [Flavobacterium psychrophilum]EKT2072344.1 adenine deaminase [Flavobacterium psychrophilum]EKT4491773.1 adenine deaminase [Flavobacterium psychrophilum]MBF2045410.1 adenine deaminase [Flavobacterium psychrophilum]
MQIQGQIVDIENKRIYSGEITIQNGKIISIIEKNHEVKNYILPGFIDAHIHIESSMLVPSEFAKIAVLHGTVATISDPHEIANVLGKKGVYYMIENGKQVPLKFHFGAPSCVPATAFETAGAIIDSEEIKELMASPDIYYLSEMMNYPGVLFDDDEVLKKIAWAKHFNKPIDGHAPGLRGEPIKKYISAGITTDHECFTYSEAQEKLSLGMKVIIREGSAAKNFEVLISLLPANYENMMFCSDDKHPDDLILGHINLLCARAVAKGIDVFKILQVACVNPVHHYKMKVGLLKKNDAADFIVVEDLVNFKVNKTYINGELVAENGQSFVENINFETPNNFNITKKKISDFEIPSLAEKIRVIEALEGQLITNEIHHNSFIKNGKLVSDIENDILKMAVVNRYQNTTPAIAFIKNFGLKKGAIASSVAHDCHNIVVVGTSDEEICNAVNLIIKNTGGICAVNGTQNKSLALPVAGIMSDKDAWETGKLYQEIDAMAKDLGSTLKAPFMTLSFMALLVIPDLKLSDKGLFSGNTFSFVDLNVE